MKSFNECIIIIQRLLKQRLYIFVINDTRFISIFLQILYYLLKERKNDLYLTSRRNNHQKIQREARI